MEDAILAAIQNGLCILFIGPQFARDADGRKMYVELKNLLDKPNAGIEFGFENLYILRDSARAQNQINALLLQTTIAKYYNQTPPNPIYRRIAALPFSAIINCSPDNYLEKIFRDEKIDVDFQFYSHKGNNLVAKPDGLPLVYNVFGNVQDPQSLIVSYDNFYTFIMSFLGDAHSLPTNLQTALNQAIGLVFLGFDLDKWYIPLLIRRLKYPVKEDNRAKTPSSAFVSKDNFNAANVETQQKFYPIELIVSEHDALGLVQNLYDSLKNTEGSSSILRFDADVQKVSAPPKIETVGQKIGRLLAEKNVAGAMTTATDLAKAKNFADCAEAIRAFIAAAFLGESLDLLGAAFREKTGQVPDFIFAQKGRFSSNVEDRNTGRISLEMFNQTRLFIGETLLGFCNDLTN